MGLGTLFGGWRIVKTMGMRITKLKPVSGFCASASGAATLFIATGLGVPVSTTHTITGAIVGVGSVQKLSAVRWGVAGNIVWAWLFTIPCSAFVAAVAWWVAQHYFLNLGRRAGQRGQFCRTSYSANRSTARWRQRSPSSRCHVLDAQ